MLMSLSVAGSAQSATDYQIPASVAGDCSVDVTQPILAWIASVPDSSTLSFTAGACYRIEGTLEIRDRTGLDLEGNSATFRSFDAPDGQRSMWRVIGSSGVILRNMTLIGSYADGGRFESSLQHAHGLDLRGSSADIDEVSVERVAGDCFYFGLGYDGLTQSSGGVHDSSCSLTGRNGVSVTAAHDVVVRRVTLDKIGFTAFDVEPNVATGNWGASNITIDGNTIGSYYLNAYSVVENAPERNLSFTNNKVLGEGLRVQIVNPGAQDIRPQSVTIAGNSSDTAQWSPAIDAYNVDVLKVAGNTVPMSGGAMANVQNSCAVDISGNSDPGATSEARTMLVPTSCSSTGPRISSFTPTTGPPGTRVTITGDDLGGATAVAVNGVPATYAVTSETGIVATVPPGAASGALSVTTPVGTATSSMPFTETTPPDSRRPPLIIKVKPLRGSVGTLVKVRGARLSGATSVRFHGVRAAFVVVSNGTIKARVPRGASTGRITVITPAGSAKSTRRFRLMHL
jgi:hypothetical protein